MTMMKSSFELTLNLSYRFEFRNFMKLSVKITLMTVFGDDLFISEKGTNEKYYELLQNPSGTRYKPTP